jgi:hypothetical protein
MTAKLFLAQFLLVNIHIRPLPLAVMGKRDKNLTFGKPKMHAATLEPLLHQCNEAIDLAKRGAIDEARTCLDRIRCLRAMLVRNKSEDSGQGAHLETSMAHSAEFLRSSAQVAKGVNERLQMLEQWISSSRAAFSIEELRESRAGLHLFLDDALPSIWDFTQDIVVLRGSEGEILRELLRERGQLKFIWITDEKLLDPGLDGEYHDTLSVAPGEYPDRETLQAFLGRFSTPRAALITTTCLADNEQHFLTVARAIGSAVIGGATTTWLPKITAEQWLKLAPQLANLNSVMALKSEFSERDVLVVSPGPSLQQDLALLAEVQDRFLIVASMKSLSALFNAGIKPDLAIWQDPRDHSEAIPDHPEIGSVGLILNEGCHPAFYKAGFATHFPYPDPGFIGTDLSRAIHGENLPKFAGTSVSTLSTIIALEFGARSVTLIGQDLSIGGGLYVSGGSPTEEIAPAQQDYLTCKGINGESLPTLPNYYAFIGEFQNIAGYYKDRVPLRNATAVGAYLEGWEHLRLADHPVVTSDHSSHQKRDIVALFDQFEPRYEVVARALEEMISRLDHAAKICDEICRECLEKVQSGGNDCTVIDLLEQRLKRIFDEECPLLKYYTSRQSMALTAATESVQNLEQNLRVSADYYEAIAQASRQLMALCRAAVEEIHIAQESMGA